MYYEVDGSDAGDASHAIEAYTMAGHMAAFGEDSRFADAPDPDTEPDPDFEGMRWEDIEREIWEYERETRAYEAEWRRYSNHLSEYGY